MLVKFSASIEQFDEKGEKTSWYYLPIPQDIASLIAPNVKKSFRVKGWLNDYEIKQIALLPMGDGSFILPLNAAIRSALKKKKGAVLKVQLEKDDEAIKLPEELIEALALAPKAANFFKQLKPSHRHYYINWVRAVRTEQNRIARSVKAVAALEQEMDFAAFVHYQKSLKP